jgi:hypothetical protein
VASTVHEKEAPSIEKVDTHRKALTLNLDPSTFGSFAEIGAGQEVARWFLVVGGASGTVAKTISAYDKEVSDDLYVFPSNVLKPCWTTSGPSCAPNWTRRAVRRPGSCAGCWRTIDMPYELTVY